MTSPQPDLETLNAYVDGELDAARAADVALRAAADPRTAEAIAALHTVRSAVRAAYAGEDVVLALPALPQRRPRAWMTMAVAAAAAVVAVTGLLAVLSRPATESPAPAALTAGPDPAKATGWTAPLAAGAPVMIPDLSPAGLLPQFIDVAKAANGVAMTEVAYAGRHGCRLSLFAADGTAAGAVADFFPDPALEVASWRANGARYFAVAKGMDRMRFAIIGAALEDATRRASPPGDQLKIALAEAHQPCQT